MEVLLVAKKSMLHVLHRAISVSSKHQPGVQEFEELQEFRIENLLP